jgi:ribonuclease D
MYSRVLLQRCYLSVVNILVVFVVQISGDTECMIVQMLYLDSIPLALVNFLKDPRIMLHGVGISGDAKKLEKDWGLKIKGAVDLGTLASTTRGQPELKNAGLKTLAKVVINFDMDKPKRVTMSNWAKCELDRIQVEYASLDAWVAYAIHQELVKCKNLSMDT